MSRDNKYGHITNHTQLMYEIQALSSKKAEQEEKLKLQAKELYASFHTFDLFGKTISNIFNVPDIKKNILQTGITLLSQFVISKFFRKGNTFKSFLYSIIAGQIADLTLNNKPDFIVTWINKLEDFLKKIKNDFFEKKEY